MKKFIRIYRIYIFILDSILPKCFFRENKNRFYSYNKNFVLNFILKIIFCFSNFFVFRFPLSFIILEINKNNLQLLTSNYLVTICSDFETLYLTLECLNPTLEYGEIRFKERELF